MDISSPPEKFAKLIALSGPLQIVGRTEYILEHGIYKIGRHSECDVVVRDRDENQRIVSRLHAEIEYKDLRYVLRDRKSRNGTFVNGRRIMEEWILEDQDLIGVGMAESILRFNDPNATLTKSTRLRFDEQTQQFFLEQEALDLTGSEFRLLYHLYRNACKLCTRESCAEAIWGRPYDPVLDNPNLDRFMRDLREKMNEKLSGSGKLIETRRGHGYLLTP